MLSIYFKQRVRKCR